MITGVGIDTIDPSRLAQQFHIQEDLKRDLFTPSEIGYCDSQADGPRHYAALFAAKEAILKALSIGLTKGVLFRDIEIVPASGERTKVILHGQVLQFATEHNIDSERMNLAMSNGGPFACAVVTIDQIKEN